MKRTVTGYAVFFVGVLFSLFVMSLAPVKESKAQVIGAPAPSYYGVFTCGAVIPMYQDMTYTGLGKRYQGSQTSNGTTITVACIPSWPGNPANKANVAAYITTNNVTYSFWYNDQCLWTDWFNGTGYTLANVTPNLTETTGVYVLIASSHAVFPGQQ